MTSLSHVHRHRISERACYKYVHPHKYTYIIIYGVRSIYVLVSEAGRRSRLAGRQHPSRHMHVQEPAYPTRADARAGWPRGRSPHLLFYPVGSIKIISPGTSAARARRATVRARMYYIYLQVCIRSTLNPAGFLARNQGTREDARQGTCCAYIHPSLETAASCVRFTPHHDDCGEPWEVTCSQTQLRPAA